MTLTSFQPILEMSPVFPRLVQTPAASQSRASLHRHEKFVLRLRYFSLYYIFFALITLFGNVPAVYARETVAPSKDRPSRIPQQKTNFMVATIIGVVLMVLAASIGIVLASRCRIRGTMKSLLGPLMGVTSVLWVMMRNDPAVRPELSWMYV
jgi:hypothetical protein